MATGASGIEEDVLIGEAFGVGHTVQDGDGERDLIAM